MKLHKSPYLRLTLFYVLIVMTISMLFSFVIFNLSSKELDSGLGRQSRVIWNIGQNNGMMTPFSDIDQIRQNQLSESEDNLRDNLIYWNLIILILSSFLSYFLAKSSMRPIEDALYSQNCFTADASHELRTPLTAMKTEVEVALRDKEMSLADAKKLLESNLEEIEKLEKQAQEIDRENLEIQERLVYLESEEYKKKEAKDKLGLRNLGEFVVFVKPRVSREDNSADREIAAAKSTAPDKSPVPNPVKWWQYFFNQSVFLSCLKDFFYFFIRFLIILRCHYNQKPFCYMNFLGLYQKHII